MSGLFISPLCLFPVKFISPPNKLLMLHLSLGAAFLLWSAILAGLYVWSIKEQTAHHENLIAFRAKELANQTQVLRRWIGGHGGIYVEEGGDIRSNPQLADVPDRDVLTPQGRKLTLLNSPTVLRKLFSEFEGTSEDRIRLVAYAPVNSSGKPDSWEKKSLDSLQKGGKLFQEKVNDGEKTLFRMMYPIKSQPKCIRCHTFGRGDREKVVGGLSISVDRTSADLEFQTLTERVRVTYFMIWCSGLLAILLSDRVAVKLLNKIDYTATRDHLTRLYNRGAIEERMDYCLKVADRYEQPLSILLLDIDHFKQVNDTYGHSVGDRALQVVSDTLRATLRESDMVGRIGGEEFLVLAPHTSQDDAVSLARRMLDAIPRAPVYVDDSTVLALTVSIGVACRMEQSQSSEALLKEADTALYRAKRNGRNRLCIAEQEVC